MNAGYFKPGLIPWNKGLKGVNGSSETRFKKGNVTWNIRPVSAQRIDVDGYTYERVAERYKSNFWRLKHHILWEHYNGEIPCGSIVRFLDNNKANITINNLFVVTRAEHAILNHSHFADEPLELKPVILMLVRLKSKMREISKK